MNQAKNQAPRKADEQSQKHSPHQGQDQANIHPKAHAEHQEKAQAQSHASKQAPNDAPSKAANHAPTKDNVAQKLKFASNIAKKWLIQAQQILPTVLITYIVGRLSYVRTSVVKNTLIRLFTQFFPINWDESEKKSADEFPTFHDFFTRNLVKDARPIAEASFVAPSDGKISQMGAIDEDTIIQAKGKKMKVSSLLALDAFEKAPSMDFDKGSFATIYLAPCDYHRVHMPQDAKLVGMHYIPGRLFSVSEATAANINDLFARNERLVAYFESPHGNFAMIMVGAMVVGGIEIQGYGRVARTVRPRSIEALCGRSYQKGDEFGMFSLGSTVIVVREAHRSSGGEAAATLGKIRMGETLF